MNAFPFKSPLQEILAKQAMAAQFFGQTQKDQSKLRKTGMEQSEANSGEIGGKGDVIMTSRKLKKKRVSSIKGRRFSRPDSALRTKWKSWSDSKAVDASEIQRYTRN